MIFTRVNCSFHSWNSVRAAFTQGRENCVRIRMESHYAIWRIDQDFISTVYAIVTEERMVARMHGIQIINLAECKI